MKLNNHVIGLPIAEEPFHTTWHADRVPKAMRLINKVSFPGKNNPNYRLLQVSYFNFNAWILPMFPDKTKVVA